MQNSQVLFSRTHKVQFARIRKVQFPRIRKVFFFWRIRMFYSQEFIKTLQKLVSPYLVGHDLIFFGKFSLIALKDFVRRTFSIFRFNLHSMLWVMDVWGFPSHKCSFVCVKKRPGCISVQPIIQSRRNVLGPGDWWSHHFLEDTQPNLN